MGHARVVEGLRWARAGCVEQIRGGDHGQPLGVTQASQSESEVRW